MLKKKQYTPPLGHSVSPRGDGEARQPFHFGVIEGTGVGRIADTLARPGTKVCGDKEVPKGRSIQEKLGLPSSTNGRKGIPHERIHMFKDKGGSSSKVGGIANIWMLFIHLIHSVCVH